MTEKRVLHDATALSSSTIATLTGFTHYKDIDRAQGQFVQFVASNPHFATWQEAWQAFTNPCQFCDGCEIMRDCPAEIMEEE